MKNNDKKKANSIKNWQNIVIVNNDSEPIAVISDNQIILKNGYKYEIDVGLDNQPKLLFLDESGLETGVGLLPIFLTVQLL